jgi:RNA-directed DNA polymerase
MTAMAMPSAGASSAVIPNWEAINWQKAVLQVCRLQMRIVKAFQEKKHSKVKALQWILTHSFSAKLLAVKRVVQNEGAKTPGVDGVIWKTPKQKMEAARSLKRRGYQTKPLKRIYIPKKQKGKLRPLSIPAMKCRAQQALYLLALEPIAEITADQNSFGFRPLRSTADAIEKCFKALSRRTSAQYALEGDIKSCFDSISNQWLREKVPTDKKMLGKWLAAGYIENGKQHPTIRGTPQGGLISPTLLVMTLTGLEAAVKAVTTSRDKVNICVYADDFIITGATKEVLENKVKPAVEAFLSERGLSLSQEKTKITHIHEGFDFLGMNIRKFKSKLIIKPAKSSVKRFLADIRGIVKDNRTAKTENLIRQLNPKIRGWANYYRHVCSKATFNYIDCHIFKAIWKWSVRRHPNKGTKWIKNKYFRQHKQRNWVFSAKVKGKNGQMIHLNLLQMQKTPIKRHIKIKAGATPFNSIYHEYLGKRITQGMSIKKSRKRSGWWLCWWNLFTPRKERENRIIYDGLIKA